MATTPLNLDEMYARLALEEEDGGGLIVGEKEVHRQRKSLFWSENCLRREILISKPCKTF